MSTVLSEPRCKRCGDTGKVLLCREYVRSRGRCCETGHVRRTCPGDSLPCPECTDAYAVVAPKLSFQTLLTAAGIGAVAVWQMLPPLLWLSNLFTPKS